MRFKSGSVLVATITVTMALSVGAVVLNPFKPTTIEEILQRSTVKPVKTGLIHKLPKLKREDIKQLAAPRCGGSDIGWLACAIYHEARGEPKEGQHLVGWSIVQRRDDPRWPNTIETVIRQDESKYNGCQYSFRCDGKRKRIKDLAAWTTALRVATLVFDEYWRGVRMGCSHSYHAITMTSKKAWRWFNTLQRVDQIGRHVFYCDKTPLVSKKLERKEGVYQTS